MTYNDFDDLTLPTDTEVLDLLDRTAPEDRERIAGQLSRGELRVKNQVPEQQREIMEKRQTRTESLLARVAVHVSGETIESLGRAGFFPWEVERQIKFGHLQRCGDRIRYVYRDPADEGADLA